MADLPGRIQGCVRKRPHAPLITANSVPEKEICSYVLEER